MKVALHVGLVGVVLAFVQATVKNYPVSKVVVLLKDMQAQLEAEADKDEEVYEKLSCWCQTNDKAKSKAIEDADRRIIQLGNSIEEAAALSSSLKVEIDNLEKELEKNKQSLETATALRKKQASGFHEEEKEMIQSISALDAAIKVLSKHHGGAFLDKGALTGIGATLQKQIQQYADVLQGVITPHQKHLLMGLVQESQTPSGANFKRAYTPQSSEIFGILRQMKETFEGSLSESQREEVAAKEAYEALKVAKENEIKVGTASLDDKKQHLATTEDNMEQAKQDREDTRASLSADEQFLMDLKKRCTETDDEWATRKKTRQEEIAAVTKAIAILSSDDARDLFSKTFNPSSFLQVGSIPARRAAARVLTTAASKTNNLKLATLASSVRLDAFTRVKKAIDDMVVQIANEMDADVQHKDYCVKELNSNERATAKELHSKDKHQSAVDQLKTAIKDYESALETLKSEINQLQSQRERAKEDRDQAKAEFESTMLEQKQAQALLQEALTALKKAYSQPEFLMQRAVHAHIAGQTPPEGFQSYEKSGAAPGVLGMIQQIIEDTKSMIAEAMHDEDQGQLAYISFVDKTTKAVEAKQASILHKQGEKAEAEKTLLEAESDLEGTTEELETLSKAASDLRGDCDFLLKNFDVRQEAMAGEIQALRQAKAYLSGMDASSGAA